MTIIQIASSFAGGGAPQMILRLAKLSHPEIKTIVISISSINTLEPKFEEAGIEYHFLGINSFRNKTILSGLNKFHSIVKEYPDAILHCHQHHSAFLAILHRVFYFKKIPFAFTLHTNKVDSIVRRVFLFLTKPFRKADIIFSESGRKWYLNNTDIIANGVDFSDFNANLNRDYKESEIFSFLYLGRLSHEKNPFRMIDAAKELLASGQDNFVIDFVGDGGLRKELEEKIDSENLSKYIKVHGFQNNVQQIINDAHCMVIPSYREGLPVVMVEAAASLLPIISTPVGSIPDFLNETNGYLTSHDDFGKTMLKVVTNYPEALRRAIKLDEDAKNIFDIKNVYAKHLALYKSISRSN